MSARRSSAKMGKPAVNSGEENALFKKTVREVVIPPLEQGYSVSIGCFVGAILGAFPVSPGRRTGVSAHHSHVYLSILQHQLLHPSMGTLLAFFAARALLSSVSLSSGRLTHGGRLLSLGDIPPSSVAIVWLPHAGALLSQCRYPSAMALHYVVGVMMQNSQVASVFGRFQYIDRVMYSTILGVAIGYSRDNTMNRSFAKLACGPEWDELDFTLNEPSDASGSQRGSTS